MRLVVVLLRDVWLEVLCTGPLDLPQLTSECRTTYRVRQIAWFPWRISGGWQWRTARGAGCARTSNYVRRSSIPSRRPCPARASLPACMLVLNIPRSTSLILAQRTYGAANAMTLLVPRLLRGARCAHGRRGLCRLVLGLGRTEGSLVDAHSSASVHSTTRLLRRR